MIQYVLKLLGNLKLLDQPNMDYYKTLGLKKGCFQNDIYKAYRKLTIEICKAFEVLSDPVKRFNYDELMREEGKLCNKESSNNLDTD